MGTIALLTRSVLLVGLSTAVSLTACESDSGSSGEQGGAGASSHGGSSSTTTSGGGMASSGSGGAGGGSSGTGGSSSSNHYVEPAAIVGGPCTGTPTAVSPPCSGAAAQEYCRLTDPSEVIMAVCSAVGHEQCEVMDDCEAGWHACTATDYVARGGRDVVPDFSTTTRAWLAACVQDLGDSQFRNEPCTYCGDAGFAPVVEWWCDGEVVYEGGMAGTTLGVVADPLCMRLGSNLPANGAYWGMAFTTGAPSFVMCCLDVL
jgi:hypothetical protein